MALEILKSRHKLYSVLPFHQCWMFPAEILNLCHHGGVVSVALDETLILRLWCSHGRLWLGRNLHFASLPFYRRFDVTGWCGVVLLNQVLNPPPVACDPFINLLSRAPCGHYWHYWAPLYIRVQEMSAVERSRSHH